jgi:hypothetical protein
VQRSLGFIVACLIASCAVPTATQSAPSPAPPTVPPTALPTSPPPTPTPATLEVAIPNPEEVALDFVATVCTARWSNSGEQLLCPGDPADTGAGYVDRVDGTTTESGLLVDAPALLTIPAYDSDYGGIFGAYPPFTIYPGDVFRAALACQESETPCDVSFDLHYYDETGRFRHLPEAFVSKHFKEEGTAGGATYELNLGLTSMAGETVEFVLTVRGEWGAGENRALWIAPHIWRHPDAKSYEETFPSFDTPTLSPEERASSVPGVIAGMVDMSSAPPYLNDPITTGGDGVPVVVTFFHMEEDIWWWIHTTLTHPNYQMTVPPGNYHVVAYAPGVGDVPYVTGGYTGQNPSCGQDLKAVHVKPNQHLQGIDITDWNWACGGDAYRPEKPDEVPLP